MVSCPLLSLSKLLREVLVLNLQLLMIFRQLIEVAALVFQGLFVISYFTLQLGNPVLQKLFLRLDVFHLFLLCQDKSLNFFIKNPLYFIESLFVLNLILSKNLLVHSYLLGQCQFDALLFFLELAKPVLQQAVKGLRIADFAGLFLYFLHGDDFSIEYVVCESAWSIGECCESPFAILVRG